jgi:hypothetical protein
VQSPDPDAADDVSVSANWTGFIGIDSPLPDPLPQRGEGASQRGNASSSSTGAALPARAEPVTVPTDWSARSHRDEPFEALEFKVGQLLGDDPD